MIREMTKSTVGGALLLITGAASAAGIVTEVPFEWDPSGALDWVDADDDYSSGLVDLGFKVTLGGKQFRYFEISSNGYVELLAEGESPNYNQYGHIEDLITTFADDTFILAAYDDLDSAHYGYYGYALHGDHAVFNWVTETYIDGGEGLMNIFQMVLNSDGSVQWNFLDAGYQNYGFDLFTGLYLGATGELVEVIRDEIPVLTSYRYSPVPVPGAVWLFGSGLLGILAVARRGRARGG